MRLEQRASESKRGVQWRQALHGKITGVLGITEADDFTTAAQTHSTGRPGDSDDSTGGLGNAAVPDSAGIPGSLI